MISDSFKELVSIILNTNSFTRLKSLIKENPTRNRKLARVIEIFGKRLQTQETMTAQIADTIQKVLQPKGVAVVVDASHQCMTTRGIHKTESSTITSRMLGAFRDNPETRSEFMNLINSPKDF